MAHSSSSGTKVGGNEALDAAIDFTGGCLGGVASVYVGQPLDTVKVKMQTFPTMYKNAFNCFVKTYKQEGLARGLYAGTVPSLAAQVSENAVLFMFYGVCQKGVMYAAGKNDVLELSVVQNAFSGCFAGFFSSFVLCPTELVKCKLQAMKEMNAMENPGAAKNLIGPWGLTKQILQTDGVKGLFRGLVPTFAREMPGYFFFFGGYEISRALLTPPGKKKDDIGSIRTIISGGFGGIALWAAIFPADVIKSRAQVGSETSGLSFVGVFKKILRTEGVRALYAGLGPTLLRTFPATGALFLAVETTKRVLHDVTH